jgi:ABC-2 type transport system ATP-binding protein
MNLICGALKPDRGQIRVDGLPPEKARLKPRLLGWLPERAPLNPELSVLEHLCLTAKFRGLEIKEAASEIERLASALDLFPKLERLAGRLSLGSRRQAALAIALLGNPAALILDEPSSSLDPDQVKRLNGLISSLPERTTLVISTHILPEARALTDRAAILSGGRLKAWGPWEKLESLPDTAQSGTQSDLTELAYFRALEETDCPLPA